MLSAVGCSSCAPMNSAHPRGRIEHSHGALHITAFGKLVLLAKLEEINYEQDGVFSLTSSQKRAFRHFKMQLCR